MTPTAAITVNRPRETVEQLWQSSDRPPATFADAPGDRGTEIRIQVETRGGRLGKVGRKVAGALPRAKAMDELRRFKQQVETGVVPRSDGTPQGERVARKLKQRPAQPLSEEELHEVGVR